MDASSYAERRAIETGRRIGRLEGVAQLVRARLQAHLPRIDDKRMRADLEELLPMLDRALED